MKKCLILNPYTKTLAPANIPQTLENWYAIIGTDNVQQFYVDGTDAACLYDDGYTAINKPILLGTTFPDWMQPIMGTLIFIGPPDGNGDTTDLSEKDISILKQKFKTAKIKLYRGD